MRSFNSFSGKAAKNNAQTNPQTTTWDDVTTTKKATANGGDVNHMVEYMVSEEFRKDVSIFLLSANKKADISLELATCIQAVAEKLEGKIVNLTTFQVMILANLGMKLKPGLKLPSDFSFMPDDEIMAYIRSDGYKVDVDKFFYGKKMSPDFEKFIRNMKDRADGVDVGAFNGWDITFSRVDSSGKEKPLSDLETLLVLALNHDGVLLENLEPTLPLKIKDPTGAETHDKDLANEYFKTIGCAYPGKEGK